MRGVFLLGRPLSPSCLQLKLSGLGLGRAWYSTGTNPKETRLGRKSVKGPYHPGLLPDHPCRTRFAPSPTGYLHLGSLRTALYSYLLARATKGQFILRIEDTDQARTVPDGEKRLMEDLKWAGLSWDEGPDVSGPYGPYRQSERLELYQSHADELIAADKAYRCFCSKERLLEDAAAANTIDGRTGYPGTCGNMTPEESEDRASKGEPYTVRFRSPKRPTAVRDIVFQKFQKVIPEEDFVIMKSDGFPTYHFANVVDDKHMGITHVIRGSEWLISTPKHVDMYHAFGWEPPEFAHVGLLVDLKNQKLSKRHPGVDMSYYKDRGILPAALLNFAALLGWGKRAQKSDVMSLQEMEDHFTLGFTRGDIKVTMDKLPHLQRAHLHRLIESTSPQDLAQKREFLLRPLEKLVPRSGKPSLHSLPNDTIGEPVPAVRGGGGDGDGSRRADYLLRVLRVVQGFLPGEAAKFVVKNRYLFWEVPHTVLVRAFVENKLGSAVFASGRGTKTSDFLRAALVTLRAVPDETWAAEGLDKSVVLQLAEDMKCAVEETAAPSQAGGYRILRWALVGSAPGGGLAEIASLLGKAETIQRFETAVAVAAAEEGK